MEPPNTVQKVYSGAADGQRELLALIGCYIYGIALYGSFPGRTNLSVLPGLLEASTADPADPADPSCPGVLALQTMRESPWHR